MKNINKKTEIVSGLFLASFIGLSIVLSLFLWSPASYLLGKWNDFWENVPVETVQPPTAYKNRREAFMDCDKRASKLYGQPHTSSYASSTSGDYETYDCYAIKYNKIN